MTVFFFTSRETSCKLIPSVHKLCFAAMKTVWIDIDARLCHLCQLYTMFTIENQTHTHTKEVKVYEF